MTSTDKSVTRVTKEEYRVLYSEARPVVVRIAPGDVLQFREHGRREWFDLPVEVAFRLAVQRAAERQAA